jgi:integration host factor subunit alpha
MMFIPKEPEMIEFAVMAQRRLRSDQGAAGRTAVRQIGLNKRESKDMVDAFFDLISKSWWRAKMSSCRAFGNFQIRTKAPRPDATRAPAS